MSTPACTRCTLLLLLVWCAGAGPVTVRYRLPRGPIRRTAVRQGATVQDLYSHLRSSGVMNTSCSLRVDGRGPREALSDTDTSLCHAVLSPDDILLVMHGDGPREWGRKGHSRSREAPAGKGCAAEVAVPSEALVAMQRIAAGAPVLGVLVGPAASSRGLTGRMVFQLPFVGPGEEVRAGDVNAALRRLEDVQLIARASGCGIQGVVVPTHGAAMAPRYLYLNILFSEYLAKYDLCFISVASQNSSRVSRRLGTPLTTTSDGKSPSYSIEAYDLAPIAKIFSTAQIVPSYFSYPDEFLDRMNSKGRLVKTLKPVTVAGTEMGEVDPLLLLRNMAVTMKPSEIEHRFPHADPKEQARLGSDLVRSIRRSLQRPRALRSLLRDPELLVYIRNNFYADDVPTFLSVCRFVLSGDNFDTLQESSVVAAMELLVEKSHKSSDVD